jgi:hypothetical protein
MGAKTGRIRELTSWAIASGLEFVLCGPRKPLDLRNHAGWAERLCNRSDLNAMKHTRKYRSATV